MSVDPNVVKPGESPTSPATTTPSPSASPASAASSGKPADGKPTGTGAPATGAGEKPEAKTVPIEALHEERTKRQQADTQLAQLKAILGDKFTIDANGNVVPIAATSSQQQPTDQVNVLQQVEKAWEEDPKKAVRMEQMLALNWYDNMFWSLEDQKDVLRDKYPDFSKYEKDISKYIRRLPMDQRGQTGAVELAYLVVKGKTGVPNIDDIKKQWEAEFRAKMAAGDAAQGINGGTSSAPSGPVKASEDQVKAAAAMGMSIDDYMKYAVR